MFGQGIHYKSGKRLLKEGFSFCVHECHFYKNKEGSCPGGPFQECIDIAKRDTGEPNIWFKRIIRWITA